MRLSQLKRESGLTLVEVLVGAVIFMVGFTSLTAMLGIVTERLSARDLMLAQSISEEYIQTAELAHRIEPGSGDDFVTRNDIVFRVHWQVTADSLINTVDVEVCRRLNNRSLIRMYYEFSVLHNR